MRVGLQGAAANFAGWNGMIDEKFRERCGVSGEERSGGDGPALYDFFGERYGWMGNSF